MKRIAVFALALIMALTFAPVYAYAANTSSNNDGWEEVFSCHNDTLSIEVTQKNTKFLRIIWYSRLKIKVVETSATGEKTVTQYITTETEHWFCSAPSIQSICNKDKNLGEEFYSNLKNLYDYNQIIECPEKYLSETAVAEYKETVKGEITSYAISTVDSKIKKLIKIDTPFLDLKNDVKDAFILTNKMGEDASRAVDSLTIILEKVLSILRGEPKPGTTSNKYVELRDEAINKIVETIKDIGN